MKPKSSNTKLPAKSPADRVVKDIRRQTRRHFSAEDKIRIVLEGLRGDDSIAELCRKEGIAQSLYYTWSKEFMEAGKRRLAGDTARAATTGDVQDLRREARALKECVADLTLENRLLKKHDRGWGRRRMRYPASEKLEIIRIVEQSHLPTKRTLDQLGIARRTFYRWYDRYLEGGPEALADKPSAPSRVWNRIGEDIQDQIVEMALEATDLSPRELAVRFTDEKHYFVSEATVYRLLKAHDLITSPAYTVIKAADQFHTKTTRPNEMWQTDFTYFKIIGWGWMYLSTVLDDFSRYVIAWKLCTNMRAEDVTDTLDLALSASGCNSATVLHKPRLLSDNGPSYIAGELAEYIEANKMSHVRGAPCHPQTQGKIERWHQTLKNRILLENYFLPGDLEAQIEAFVEHYNHQRYHESLNNVTPADAYFGRAPAIIKQRERIKRKTIEHRRLQHRKLAA
ncbi:IS3 family transposase [Pseudosulfitobacter pseudonitzschiae]|uniref:IS3 family transposase n=2 Tax=Pseudosulfitobacter pseudonitzschiae TaxID=1402135 RepID=UPI001AF5D540|nr:IS3 family transposase [Pseudosulfitobacter pseudonitzschiae]MCI2213001.1 IS3 family transposase [Pseudosulfitobacter pseudonitzschiae]QRD48659.1 IS3 family transposase [Pseudosulfitobacter pseudonitzschiae]QSH70610.1 IS3 family transposase [Pseudosulfitobacter pseudonitzschiae]UFE31153.1 IS3 family transposase [Pseudosulfitobacter pseudonitzschiae]UFE40533.1 IS3 family transposase [Pseudosulfitobacter pseudonitzschiae]